MSNNRDRRDNLNESARLGNGNGAINGLGTTKITRGLFNGNVYNRSLTKDKELLKKKNT
ncbi:hypothetical protein [Priestia aryabhattai]